MQLKCQGQNPKLLLSAVSQIACCSTIYLTHNLIRVRYMPSLNTALFCHG